jgi:hypothetical protein
MTQDITNASFFTLAGATVGAVAGLVGSIVGAGVALKINQQTLEFRQRARYVRFLETQLSILCSCLADYEEWLEKHHSYGDPARGSDAALQHARIIGRAIAACLAVNDREEKSDVPDTDIKKANGLPPVPTSENQKLQVIHRLDYIAHKRLTRNPVKPENAQGNKEKGEVERWGHYHDRNRDALHHAIQRLSYIIENRYN